MTEKTEKSDKEPICLSDLQNKDGKGLACRDCGCRDFRTPHTRRMSNGILRERACRKCGKVILTKEKVWAEPPAK
jgi:DNA-directed RNA polymerase subunit RPC12/RpoP